MGFTKKQRREQKKHAFAASNHEKAKRRQRRVREDPDQPTTTIAGQDTPTPTSQQGPSMVLFKTLWTEPGGNPRQDFQLVEVPAGRDQEYVRKDFLANLQAHRVQDGTVEIYDPDNVPPGTIPADAAVTLSKPLFNN
jgi:hypothetical protein